MKKFNAKKERRKYPRAGTYHLMKYSCLRPELASHCILSISRNVSGGGLMLVTEEELKVGDQIAVELHFPPFSESIKAKGEIVYVNKQTKSNKWHAGVKFTELDDLSRQRIIDYVDYRIKNVKHLKKI